MKLAIDAMGGDHAPKAIIEGVEKATAQFKELHITLIGNESEIKKYLTSSDRISIIHTEEKPLMQLMSQCELCAVKNKRLWY